jgi:hypothetical protein
MAAFIALFLPLLNVRRAQIHRVNFGPGSLDQEF